MPREIQQYFKVNECENKIYQHKTCQHLWGAANSVLRGKFIMLSRLTLEKMKGLKSII